MGRKPTNPSKAWAEDFFAIYSVVWILAFGLVVVTGVYIHWTDVEYLSLAIGLAAPFVLYPLFFPGQVDKGTKITERYWFKANVWTAIFSYVGNYFYTHYFYKVLGARYTFPVDIQLNEVPVFLYLLTHIYFMSYFTFSNVMIRLLRTSKAYLKMNEVGRLVSNSLLIFVMSVITAFMETFTIQSVPYYSHDSKFFMYTVGSLFYGWYFYVAFPMHFMIDEKPGRPWTFWRTAVNSFAACMIVLIFLDLTRLCLIHFNVTAHSTVPFL